jgi:hypothetical protein
MKTILRALLAALLAAAFAAAAAEPVAFITNVKGDVTIDGVTRAALLAELSKGQRLVLGKEAHASVMYTTSGKEYMLRGPADYVVKDVEIASSSGMPPVARATEWRTSGAVLAQVSQTSAASVRMRSIGKPKAPTEVLLFPTQGKVSTLQPTLRWRGEGKAASQVELQIVGEEKAVHVAKVTGSSYRVPVKLKPDTEYAWTISAGADEIGTGKFRTLGAEDLAQVEHRRPSDKAEFSDRVLFALMLHQMGATQEAHEAWAKLSQERSDLPELAALAK